MVTMIKQFLNLNSIIYFIGMLISGYGVCLFAWWWRKMGRATEVYAYMTFLLVGIFITTGIGIYARSLHFNLVCESCGAYHEFLNSFWWALGPLLVILVVLTIVVRMSRRVFAKERLVEVICPHCGHPCPIHKELLAILKTQLNNINEETKT